MGLDARKVAVITAAVQAYIGASGGSGFIAARNGYHSTGYSAWAISGRRHMMHMRQHWQNRMASGRPVLHRLKAY